MSILRPFLLQINYITINQVLNPDLMDFMHLESGTGRSAIHGSFGETGFRALMNMGGADVFNCGASAGGEFSAIYKDWSKANVPTDKSLDMAFEWLYQTIRPQTF